MTSAVTEREDICAIAIDKRQVERHFSRHAVHYDAITPVQSDMAERLLGSLAGLKQHARILEIGCGTGRLTERLVNALPNARIDAVDIAPGMLAQAQHRDLPNSVHWICADAEGWLAEHATAANYDLIISNATVQWFRQPTVSVNHMARLLSSGGKLRLSTFGPKTFQELQTAFKQAETNLEILPQQHVLPLVEPHDWQHWCENAGLSASVNSEVVTRPFASPSAFVHSIRQAGAANAHQPPAVMTRKLLRAMYRIYTEQFGNAHGVVASYETVFVLGDKPR